MVVRAAGGGIVVVGLVLGVVLLPGVGVVRLGEVVVAGWDPGVSCGHAWVEGDGGDGGAHFRCGRGWLEMEMLYPGVADGERRSRTISEAAVLNLSSGT